MEARHLGGLHRRRRVSVGNPVADIEGTPLDTGRMSASEGTEAVGC